MSTAWIALTDDADLDESATYYFSMSTARIATTGDSSLDESALTTTTAIKPPL